MKKTIEKLEILGVTYVPEGLSNNTEKDGMPYVMIRTYSAGVHCGYLKERDGKEVTLLESVRIWKWSGAASLSQLSQEGTNDESGCKFAIPVVKTILTEAIEVITMTEKAKESILKLATWRV